MTTVDPGHPSLLDLLVTLSAAPLAQSVQVSSPIVMAEPSAGKRAKSNVPPINNRAVRTEAVSVPVGSAPPAYLTVKQVAARLSVSVATIWRWSTENPDFPKPIHFSKGTTRWRVTEIEAFEFSLRAR